MAITSKYFIVTPTGDNLDFLDFDLRYGSVTTVGASIQFNGSVRLDSIYVRPGLTYDLTNTAASSDKILFTGTLANYAASTTGNMLTLSRTVNGLSESVTLSGGTSLSYDTLVFANGTTGANALYAAVKNNTALPTLSNTETSLSPQGAAAPGATLNAIIKAYSNNSAGVGQVGETFASTKPGIAFTANGGNGIDTVYVADGATVDATVLGASVDLVYFRGKWADYAKTTLSSGTQLQFTRSIGGRIESVTVASGNSLNYDKLIFADGAVTTDVAKIAITTNPTGPGISDPTTATPLYPDDQVQTALNAIRDAAQNNTATTPTPLAALTFATAGVTGVDAGNIASVNSALDSALVIGTLADTAPKIQTIVNAYQAVLNSADGISTNTGTALTTVQYNAIGVTGVSGTATPGSALALLNDVVDASPTAAVDTVLELQEMAVAAAHVISGAAGGTPPTLVDLTALGITGVTPLNLASAQAGIAATADNGTGVDTQAELQAVVSTTINSFATLSTTLNGVTNLDVTSNLVFSVDHSVTVGAGYIHITELGGPGYMGSTGNNTETINVATAIGNNLMSITGSGANTKIIINPQWDFDLAADYQITIDDGAFVNSIRDAAQADNASITTPSALTYHIAGVSGVDATNLASINSALDTSYVTGARADTAIEIQTIVNGYKAILAEANGAAANPNPLLSATPYTDIGVTGVSGTASAGNALFLLDDVVNNSQTAAVDTVPELQAMADAAARVITAAGGTPAQAAALTQTDLTNLGITGVGPDNIGAIRTAIQASAPSAVDTQAELQALVTLLPPPPPTINTVAGDDFINLSEVGSLISGTNQIGDTVTLNLGGVARTATVSGTTWSYMLQAADITNMGQGAETISATQTNSVSVTSAATTRAISIDTIPPTAILVADSLPSTASALVQSSEPGTAYLVNSSVAVTSLTSITGAADALWNSVTIGAANSNTNLALSGLQNGTYRLYSVDAAGNLSGPSSASLTVAPAVVLPPEVPPLTPPAPGPIAPVNLADIGQGVGSGGYQIWGTFGPIFDLNVSDAGDVNGDGLSDQIISGMPEFGMGATPAYVVFGKAGTTEVNLSAVAAGTGGFQIKSVPPAGFYSYITAAGAGDVNGDGLDDILVNKFEGSTTGSTTIQTSYVVFGKANGTAVDVNATATGAGGFGIVGNVGNVNNQVNGTSVSSAGDVNGDGLVDLAILGANTGGASNTVYVVYGKAGNATINLNTVGGGGTGGFIIKGIAGDTAGYAIASAGDVNGDGLADLFVSATETTIPSTDKKYVVFGSRNSADVDLSAVARGVGGFVITGESYLQPAFGIAQSSAGDVNGDGLNDLILGYSNSNGTAGVSYVVFGKADTTAVNLNTVATGVGGFKISGISANDASGYSVSSAGDVNGDGLADLIVGAYTANGSAGTSYVVYGKTDTTPVSLDAISKGSGGFAINAAHSDGYSGDSVSSAGDLNGDGLGDLLVSEVRGGNPSYCYVIFGGTQFATTVDFLGTAHDDTLRGNSAVETSETMVAGAGNDYLIGNGGADVMYGGSGNDTFVLNVSNVTALQSAMGAGGNVSQLARIDGGSGVDTIQLTGGANLNLTLVANQGGATPDGMSRINSIEKIDLATDFLANKLTLQLNDVVDMSGMNLVNAISKASLGWTGGTYAFAATESRHQLIIDGTNLDQVVSTGGFRDTGQTAIMNGHTYEVYNQGSYAQLLIDLSINRSSVM